MTPATTDQMSPNSAPAPATGPIPATGPGRPGSGTWKSALSWVPSPDDRAGGPGPRRRSGPVRCHGAGCGVAFIVDGMNVIGTQPDGWWRDRGAARRRLVEDLALLSDGMEITVVFDGRPTPGGSRVTAGGVSVSFAPGGRTRPMMPSSKW
jgi:hypothetical protein